MGEWRSVSLGQMVEHRKGYAFKSSQFRTTGHPVIRVSNFTERSISLDKCSYLSIEEASQLSSFLLIPGDIVIATVGSWPSNPASVVGRAIRVPKEADGVLLNQNAVRLRAKHGLDQRLMFYLLRDVSYQDYIVNTAQGSANQASIAVNDIFSYRFDLPPLSILRIDKY